MELYCIKTHSQKLVVEGNLYPLISDKCPCKCKVVNVGISSIHLNPHIKIGDKVKCANCREVKIYDGFVWIHKSLFANIDSISISEATEQLNQKELVKV